MYREKAIAIRAETIPYPLPPVIPPSLQETISASLRVANPAQISTPYPVTTVHPKASSRIKDDEAIYAGYELTRMEGIIPAIESVAALIMCQEGCRPSRVSGQKGMIKSASASTSSNGKKCFASKSRGFS